MSIRSERKLQIRQKIIDKVLELTFKGQSFNDISLRQLAREINLVPSALYRYFKDKDELAQALIDQVTVLIKSALFQSRSRFTLFPNETPEQRMISFFEAIEQHAPHWHFFAAERWGGYRVLEEIILEDEIDLLHDFIQDLKRLKEYQTVSKQELTLYAEMVLQLSFIWSRDWIELCQMPESLTLHKEKKRFIKRCSQKISFLKAALNLKQ